MSQITCFFGDVFQYYSLPLTRNLYDEVTLCWAPVPHAHWKSFAIRWCHWRQWVSVVWPSSSPWPNPGYATWFAKELVIDDASGTLWTLVYSVHADTSRWNRELLSARNHQALGFLVWHQSWLLVRSCNWLVTEFPQTLCLFSIDILAFMACMPRKLPMSIYTIRFITHTAFHMNRSYGSMPLLFIGREYDKTD